MTSSSPEAPARADGRSATVLRGEGAASVPSAPIGGDLRGARRASSLDTPAARAALAEAVEAARSEGYAVGYAQGRRRAAAEAETLARAEQAARQEQAEALDRALRGLTAAATAFATRTAPAWEEISSTVAGSAYALVETVLGRELDLARNPGLDAVVRVLAATPGDDPVTARLNPADHAGLSALPVPDLGRTVRMVADPAVEPGGCLAECGATRVDARLSTALTRVREVLAP